MTLRPFVRVLAFVGVLLAGLMLAACQSEGAAGKPRVVSNPSWKIGGAPAAGPRAVLRETEVDFGIVPLDTVVEYRFGLRNAGDRPLAVLEAPVAAVLEGC